MEKTEIRNPQSLGKYLAENRAEKLKAWRQSRGITMSGLALILGCSVSKIYDIERGSAIDHETLNKLSIAGAPHNVLYPSI